MGRSIDLNADMGEYSGADSARIEAELMALITSCSIACGGHTGDADTMRQTVQLAKKHSVNIGAHPSYPDREGFGRRSIDIDRAALADSLRKQIENLLEILKTENAAMRHVKPHGALYNDAACDESLAQAVVDAVNCSSDGATIVGPPDSALDVAARNAGASFIAEGFVDRLYLANGSLTPRTTPGAVIANVDARASQAVSIATGAEFAAADGALALRAATLCIHSDSPGAVDTARAVRTALVAAGLSIVPHSAAPI